MRKLLRKQGIGPQVLLTDKLPSYGAAFRDLALSDRHRMGLRLNNRAMYQWGQPAPLDAAKIGFVRLLSST